MKRILDDPDKIHNDFCVNPNRLAACIFTVLSALVLGITFLYLGNWLGAAVMAVIAGLFIWQGMIYGPWVRITCDGVCRHIFSRTLKQVRWDEIAEVGVVGTKVFNRLNPDKTGPMYIYFSPRKLTDDDRFQLALDFPPKDMLFLLHDQEREDLVQILWNTKLVGYNTGKLKLRRDTQEESHE